jgi:hypothetical protein
LSEDGKIKLEDVGAALEPVVPVTRLNGWLAVVVESQQL